MNGFKLAWKNLINRPLSNMLTLVLFALGIGISALLLLLDKQMTQNFEKNLGGISVVLGAKGSPLQLILCNMYHIDAPTGNINLKSAKPFLNPRHPLIAQSMPLSLGDSYKTHRIVGTLRDFPTLYGGTLAQGRLWDKTMEVAIGASVAQKTGLKIGDKFSSNHGLTDDGEAHEGQFVVVGIFGATGSVLDQLIVTATQSIWAVHEAHHAEEEGEEHHHEEALSDVIPADDRAALLAADSSAAITSVLIKYKMTNVQTLNFQRNINQNTDMQAATPAIEINRVFEMLGIGEKALRMLAGVIIGVSGLSIFIALFSSLRERRYELALMRVMGANRFKVFWFILLEGLLLSLLGFVLGIALGHTAMSFLADSLSQSYRYSFSAFVWLPEEWQLLAAAVFIGFVAAFFPALNAYRTDISKTLSKN